MSSRKRVALGLAIIVDLIQMIVFPLCIEGALSPADDVLDLSMAGLLSYLLAGTGSSHHHSLRNSCLVLTLCPSGHWQLQTYRQSRRLPVTIQGKIPKMS